MKFILIFLIAYMIDLIIGDPNYPLHPIRLIGKLILFFENLLYDFKNKRLSGKILLTLTAVTVFIISILLVKLGVVFEIFLLYTSLATKALINEGNRVYSILKKNDIELARRELSYLVSRDTGEMEVRDIVRSTFETVSENSVDGVIAPMFFAFLGSFFSVAGVNLAAPFALVYKSVNTLDSMVGYKNEKYIDFGRASALTDDVLNFIPARLTGILFVPIAAFIAKANWKNSIKIFLRDRKNHSSPNSACSESAFAGAFGIQLGGKTSYFGKIYDKPTIGDSIYPLDVEHIKKACNLLYFVSIIGILFFAIIKLMLN